MSPTPLPAGAVIALRSQVSGGAPPSERELVSHVVRRLGMGSSARDVAASASVDEAVVRSLDLTAPPAPMPEMEVPTSFQEARNPGGIQIPLGHWLEQMVLSNRRIEERLVWFWHDHFATGFRKVRMPYLFWQQHATIRRHATGRFDELLKAIARDPAMLDYLDGRTNQKDEVNENFAREVMELHTMGRGQYTQEDVVAAARSFTGWTIAPGTDDPRRLRIAADPFTATFLPNRHDAGTKTLLGVTGAFDMDGALDVILDHPATATKVAAKLYTELVGLPAVGATLDDLADGFRADWNIMTLVEAIVADPTFLSADAVRSRVRTPVERLVGLVQGVETDRGASRIALGILGQVDYVPFSPPNPAGFPKGDRLLGPYLLAHSLDLASLLADPPDYPTAELFGRLGLFDVSDATWSVVDRAPDARTRIALAAASPEYALT